MVKMASDQTETSGNAESAEAAAYLERRRLWVRRGLKAAALLLAVGVIGGGIGIPVALPGARGVLFQYCASACVTVSIHVLDLRTSTQKLLLDDVEKHCIREIIKPETKNANKTSECIMLISAIRRLQISTAVYVIQEEK